MTTAGYKLKMIEHSMQNYTNVHAYSCEWQLYEMYVLTAWGWKYGSFNQ